MNFEYYFTKYWWRVLLVIVCVLGPTLWVWIPSVLTALMSLSVIAIAALIGVRKLYKRITRPSCSCCRLDRVADNPDSTPCPCENHCKLHGLSTTLPQARSLR